MQLNLCKRNEDRKYCRIIGLEKQVLVFLRVAVLHRLYCKHTITLFNKTCVLIFQLKTDFNFLFTYNILIQDQLIIISTVYLNIFHPMKTAHFYIWASTRENLSLGVCQQQRRRPACQSMQSDQRLCYSLIAKYHI